MQRKTSISTVDGKVDASTAGNSMRVRAWVAVAKLGGITAYIERRLTEEEMSHLQQVFNEILVILEERLVRNREQWKYSLIRKFFDNKVFDPEFLTRTLRCRWKIRGSYDIIHMDNGVS